ncbi:CD2 antigen cytoplasmic tail-binding protein 2 [Halocaridina rubra]|uniref:CD2 antigen cytoplasmic tail-binding protein 2 n=1 Tax=Halocaridina rubra TaxID=373956 RepID=A0AAN9AB76_HALRR
METQRTPTLISHNNSDVLRLSVSYKGQMSLKRSVGPYKYDDDEDYVPTKSVKYSEREDVLPLKEKKHTLDSDEEDDADGGVEESELGEKNYDVLKDEDIDGQEEGTLDFEGENRITPFNMKEELEEGHFDGDGFYHFKKETDKIKDAWLEDIDWIKVKHHEGDDGKYGSDVESDADSNDTFSSTNNKADGSIMIYTEMLEFVREGETVAKALKRLGGNKKMSSAQKWKLKKTGSLGKENGDQNMADFLRLTELAGKIMETGNMDIYQETFEMINYKVQKASAPPAEPEMDMFAEETCETKDDKKSKETDISSSKDKSPGIAEVMWDLRWKDDDDAEIHGPFSNEKMLQWQESGYFSKGAYVRKTNQQSQWYSTRRIDFDLYT